MRAHSALDSVHGIVRTDTDHWILRYKTGLDGRDFQLLMLVEVKEHGADSDPAQRDIMRFVHLLSTRRGRNMHGATTRETARIRSEITGRTVRVKNFGYHLLQFQNTHPEDSNWIMWDRRRIHKDDLIGVLALERNPYEPERFVIEYLRDRHQKELLLPLDVA